MDIKEKILGFKNLKKGLVGIYEDGIISEISINQAIEVIEFLETQNISNIIACPTRSGGVHIEVCVGNSET